MNHRPGVLRLVRGGGCRASDSVRPAHPWAAITHRAPDAAASKLRRASVTWMQSSSEKIIDALANGPNKNENLPARATRRPKWPTVPPHDPSEPRLPPPSSPVFLDCQKNHLRKKKNQPWIVGRRRRATLNELGRERYRVARNARGRVLPSSFRDSRPPRTAWTVKANARSH